jgi:hypothetical protein
MTPRDWKSSPIFTGLLVVPALLFVVANLLAFNVFSHRFLYDNLAMPVLDEPWSAIVANLLITLGPLIAVVLSGKQIVTLRRGDQGRRAAIIQLCWGHVVIVLTSLSLATALGAISSSRTSLTPKSISRGRARGALRNATCPGVLD